MFKTPKGYQFASEDTTKIPPADFIFTARDRFEMKIFTNEGFKLIDISGSLMGPAAGEGLYYELDKDGMVKLPLLGRVRMLGLTIDSASRILEEQYSQYFIDPFVILKILNRNIFVFLGDGGARVVPLQNERTNLVEALATAGGLTEKGKAYKIKIIRGNIKEPEVYMVDLSTMKGIKNSNLYVQSNDIIYIEPVANNAQKVLTQISPVVGLITTLLLVINLVQQ